MDDDYKPFLEDTSKGLIGSTVGKVNTIQGHIAGGARSPNQFVKRNNNQLSADHKALTAVQNNVNLGQGTKAAGNHLAANMNLSNNPLATTAMGVSRIPELTQARNSFAGEFKPNLQGGSPELMSAIYAGINPVFQNLTEQALPAISSAAIQGGAFGGARQEVEQLKAVDQANVRANEIAGQIAFEDLSQRRALGTDIYNNQSELAATNLIEGDRSELIDRKQRGDLTTNMIKLENDRAAQIAASEQAGFALDLLPAQTQEAIGAAQRGEQVQSQGEQLRQFNEELELPFYGNDQLLSAMGGVPLSSGGTPASAGGGSAFGGVLGGALGGGLVGAGLAGKDGPLAGVTQSLLESLGYGKFNTGLAGLLGGGLAGGAAAFFS